MDTSTLSGNNQEKIAAIIACIPVLFWVPVIMEQKTRYVTHFMKHGFSFLVISLITQLFLGGINILSILLWPIISLVNLITLIMICYSIYHAAIGKNVIIPYYSEYLDKILIRIGIHSWFSANK